MDQGNSDVPPIRFGNLPAMTAYSGPSTKCSIQKGGSETQSASHRCRKQHRVTEACEVVSHGERRVWDGRLAMLREALRSRLTDPSTRVIDLVVGTCSVVSFIACPPTLFGFACRSANLTTDGFPSRQVCYQQATVLLAMIDHPQSLALIVTKREGRKSRWSYLS